jgi:hypothetical protein
VGDDYQFTGGEPFGLLTGVWLLLKMSFIRVEQLDWDAGNHSDFHLYNALTLF